MCLSVSQGYTVKSTVYGATAVCGRTTLAVGPLLVAQGGEDLPLVAVGGSVGDRLEGTDVLVGVGSSTASVHLVHNLALVFWTGGVRGTRAADVKWLSAFRVPPGTVCCLEGSVVEGMGLTLELVLAGGSVVLKLPLRTSLIEVGDSALLVLELTL